MRNLTTPRLELVPASLGLIQAELDSHETLATTLGVHVPEGWPPGEYDRPAIEFFQARLFENPGLAGWFGWYAILRSDGQKPATLVGAGGFFGPPTAERVVEIGYSVVPAFEGRGLATELVGALVKQAFATGRVNRIIAHTTPENVASVRVLEKSGFRLRGAGKDPGSVAYECERQGS